MRSSSIAALALSLSLVTAASMRAQTGMELEITGNAGYTAVDVDKWAGQGAWDWAQFASGGSAKLFFKSVPAGKIGVELGSRYLMWYEFRQPFGSSYVYPQYDVTAMHAALLFRMTLVPGTSFDVGAGVYAFDGGTDGALQLAVSRAFFRGPKFSIPIGLRFDQIIDSDAPMSVIGATAGIGVKF